MVALCGEKAAGGTADFRALLREHLAEIKAEYPDDPVAGDERVFLLAVQELTETLIPDKAAEEEAEAAAATETAEGAAAEEVGAGEAAADAEAEETAEDGEEYDEEYDEEAAMMAEIARLASRQNRFDGSGKKIYEKMQQVQKTLVQTDPAHREHNFAVKMAEEAQNRISIGSVVSTFWYVVSGYALIFIIGAALVIVAVVIGVSSWRIARMNPVKSLKDE